MVTSNKRYICPECGKVTATKNGTYRGAQKYYCLNCRRYVIEKKSKYSKKVKMFLATILNIMLKLKKFYFEIEELISSAKEDDYNVNDVKIVSKFLKNDTDIECYNPVLLFCYDNDTKEIVAYKFDNDFLQNTDTCEIKIIHDIKNSKSHKEKLQNKAE